MSSGGDKKTTTQTSNSDPWKPAQPALQENIAAVQGLPSLEAYNQSMVVPFSEATQTGLSGTQHSALDSVGGLQRPFQMYGDLMGQAYQDATGNFSDAYNKVKANNLEDAATQANLAYSNMGRYASGAHTGAVADTVGRLGSEMDLNQMQTGMGNVMNFGNALPGAYQSSLLPFQTMRDVGAAYEGQSANYLNDEARRFYETQQAPWDTVSQKNALLTGAGQLGGTTRGTATTPQPSFGERAAGYTAMAAGGGK